MDDRLAKWDLLYVSNADGEVTVYRYWQRVQVGTLTGFGQPMGSCVDSAGDVYITDSYFGRVIEYSHGGTRPIRTLYEKTPAFACAVNPLTGDLAVANWSRGVEIYKHARGKPQIFTDRDLKYYEGVAYDDAGNLLVTNGCKDFACRAASFAYLPNGGANLVATFIPGPKPTGEYKSVSSLQWDGKYWVIDDHRLYRVGINNYRGRLIGATKLDDGDNGPVWIYNNTVRGQGTEVVGGVGSGNDSAVLYWNYPSGGQPIGLITTKLQRPQGLSISLKIAQ